MIVNSAEDDCFLCYLRYSLLPVIVVGFEKKKVKCTRGHLKTWSWISAHSKINKLMYTSGTVVITTGSRSRDLCSISQRGLFGTLLS